VTILTRIVVIVAGYLLASLFGAVLTVTFAMAQGMIMAGMPLSDIGIAITAIGMMLPTAFAATLVLALLPTLIVIVVAETRRLRSVSYYAATGAAVGIVARLGFMVALLWFIRRSPRAPLTIVSWSTVAALAIAAAVGVIAGVVYWAIAGRGAGRLRPVAE
jgi:hypothetical protein